MTIRISARFATWCIGMATAIFNNGAGADWDPYSSPEEHFSNARGVADDLILTGDPVATEWAQQVLLFVRTVAGVLVHLLDEELAENESIDPIELFSDEV